MKKYNFAVIGSSLSHTMSPFIHNELFKINNINGRYEVINIPPEGLFNRFNEELMALDGFNVTIPHKIPIMKYLDEIDRTAKMCGAVNTVRISDGYAKGYTTDNIGFLKAMEIAGFPLDGRALLLGCGGVSRTIAHELARAGASITIAARGQSIAKANEIKASITHIYANYDIKITDIENISGEFDVLINGTPVGMYPNTESMPVPEKVIENCKCVFDTIYNPLQTQLVKTAITLEKRAVTGTHMLVAQAAASQEIWLGVKFKNEDIEKIEELLREEIVQSFDI